MPSSIELAAAHLARAAETGEWIAPLRTHWSDLAPDDGYAIQEINTRRALAGGRRLVGRKIGLTSTAVQTQLGVDQPDYGMLFADMACEPGEALAWESLHQPKAEAEVAFVLDRDLDADSLSMADVMRAIGFALPAIEVVGSRIANWQISFLDTVADNASSSHFVLGSTPVPLHGLDLRLCGMVTMRAGAIVSSGVGAACMGHPLKACLWLARKMVAVERPLRAGDIVLSGALGPMVPLSPNDRLIAEIQGLGSVEVCVEQARS